MSVSPAAKALEIRKNIIEKEGAIHDASTAIVWGSFNCVVLSIILGDLRWKGVSSHNSIMFWCAVLLCIACILNIIIHTKSYFRPTANSKKNDSKDSSKPKTSPVTNNQTSFMTSKACTPKKDVSFFALLESSLRTPPACITPSVSSTPAISATPMNYSAVSWASHLSQTPSSRSFSCTPMNLSAESWQGTPASHMSNWNTSGTPINMSAGSWGVSPMKQMSTSWGSSPFLQPSTSPLNFSLGSSFSSPLANDNSLNNTSLSSMHVNSWSYHPNNSSLVDSYELMSPFSGHDVSNSKKSTNKSITEIGKVVQIDTKEQLDQYLSEYGELKMRKQILNEMNNNASPILIDQNQTTQKREYQVATKDVEEKTSDKNEDVKISSSNSNFDKIWLKRNVTPEKLFQFEENLRIWLSSNILAPLVKTIDKTNDSLDTVAPELQIGSVSVDKLKAASQNISGMRLLANLLPFLDVTIHQDYLVHRLRQLSQGGAISPFRWDGGGSFNGKEWCDKYPTDTYILLHLFALYMDTQLPPDPTQPDGRVFSNTYLLKTPEKPPKDAHHCILYLQQVNPPLLKVILPGDEECEVGNGYKNFMHSLLLFCHHVTYKQHSRIAGVNLTMSGVNLAWVVGA